MYKGKIFAYQCTKATDYINLASYHGDGEQSYVSWLLTELQYKYTNIAVQYCNHSMLLDEYHTWNLTFSLRANPLQTAALLEHIVLLFRSFGGNREWPEIYTQICSTVFHWWKTRRIADIIQRRAEETLWNKIFSWETCSVYQILRIAVKHSHNTAPKVV